MSTFNSAQEAGGIAVGINGKISGFNADVEARLAHVLTDVGRWVEREAGALMGHIKMAVTSEEATVTMNLTDLREGVLYRGKIRPCRYADFSFMAAVLDVDEDRLRHTVLHALEDSGVNLVLEGGLESHHHDHDCGCGHDHHHEHHHDCGCGHDHHHDHEHHDHDCGCGHDHHHKHHHDHHGHKCGCGHKH